MEQKNKNIPGWLIFVGFMFGFWPGMILLLIRILGDRKEEKEDIQRQKQSPEWTPDIEWSQDGTYRSRTRVRTADGQTAPKKTGHRVYQPPKSGQKPVVRPAAKSAEASAQVFSQQGTYANVNNSGKVHRKTTGGNSRNAQAKVRRILSYKAGKTMRVVGTVLLSMGLLMAILTIAVGIDYYDPILEIIAETMLMAGPLSGAGSILLIYGSKKRKRALRCRTYASMIGKNRCVDINKLASAVGLKYDKCCDDLNWMLGEGLYPDMYIDNASQCLTYSDAAPEAPAEPRSAPKSKAAPDGTFPEELAIRRLNDAIQDPHVSERMDRLEYLTHKILAYVQAHPEKEGELRQFRTYYLPKTMHILEVYEGMERTGVAGGNINAAMQDVEKIMDKLVEGFESQLDALYDSEAMDVMTDISVLENMMNMSGMTDLDPFGTSKSGDEDIELKL